MGRSTEVADIFQAFGPAYREVYGGQLPLRHHRAMRAIEVCRTAVLGGHVDACDACGALRVSYNSCRNRSCPKCQALDVERWVEARKQDLLPVPYFPACGRQACDLYLACAAQAAGVEESEGCV